MSVRTGEHATHALVVQPFGTIDDDDVVSQVFAQVFHGLRFARSRGTFRTAAAVQMQRGGQRDVTPVGQWRDHQSPRVAQVFVPVRLFGVRLPDDDVVVVLLVPVKAQLRHPLEVGHVHAVWGTRNRLRGRVRAEIDFKTVRTQILSAPKNVMWFSQRRPTAGRVRSKNVIAKNSSEIGLGLFILNTIFETSFCLRV